MTLLVSACGSKTAPTPTPVAAAPQISCPTDMTVKGVTGTTQAVTYSAPVVTGGATPVTTSCTQASGASFPLGTTSVSCTANDAQSRQAACSFNVTLTGFSIAVTKYETVGDSLTEGENGLPLPTFVDPPNSYPTKLQNLLTASFPGQGIAVINQGVGGQRIETTLALLPDHLIADRPQALLLLGGYNNLTTPCSPGRFSTAACKTAMDDVETGIRSCIRRAKEPSFGVKNVFVSTLTPTGTVAPNSPRDLRIATEATTEVNRRIRLRTAEEGVTLVDTYPLFIGHESDYISIDGLHLKPAGYQAIADAFFAAIKTTIPQTPLFSITGSR
jgi:lysophospholipase L1-like esterase